MPRRGSRRARPAAPGPAGRPAPRTRARRGAPRRGTGPGGCRPAGRGRWCRAGSPVPPAHQAPLGRDDEGHHEGRDGGGEQALHYHGTEGDRRPDRERAQHPHALDDRGRPQGHQGDPGSGDRPLEADPTREGAGDGIRQGLHAQVRGPGRHEVEQPPGGQADGGAGHRPAQQRPRHDEHEHEVGDDGHVPSAEHDDQQHGHEHHQPSQQQRDAGGHPVPVAAGRGVERPGPSTTATTSSDVVSTAGVTVPVGASRPTPRCTVATVPTGMPGTYGRSPTLPSVVTTSPTVAAPRSTRAKESRPGSGRAPPATAAPDASPSTPRGPTRTPTVRSALPTTCTSAVHGATETTRPTRPSAATTVRSTCTPSRDPASIVTRSGPAGPEAPTATTRAGTRRAPARAGVARMPASACRNATWRWAAARRVARAACSARAADTSSSPGPASRSSGPSTAAAAPRTGSRPAAPDTPRATTRPVATSAAVSRRREWVELPRPVVTRPDVAGP